MLLREQFVLRAELGLKPAHSIRGTNATARELQRLGLQVNALRGLRAERHIEGVIQRMPGVSYGRQITIVTSAGYRARVDYVVNGTTIIEVKSSTTASLSFAQAHLARDVYSGRAVTPVGNNALQSGLTPGRPTTFDTFVTAIPY